MHRYVLLGRTLALLAACPVYALCKPAPSLDWRSGKTELDTGWRTHSGDDLALGRRVRQTRTS